MHNLLLGMANFAIADKNKPPLWGLQSLGGYLCVQVYFMQCVPKSQYELTSMLIRCCASDLKASERWLLVLLSDFGDESGKSIYPSLNKLASLSGMSKRSVQDNLNKLESKGYIARFSGGVVDGQNKTSSYFINLEKLGFGYDKKGNVVALPRAS